MGTLIDNEIFEKRRKEKELKHSKNKKLVCRVVDISRRRSFRENMDARRRINSRYIRAEMKHNGETTVFEGSHITKLKEMPRSVRELKRFLGTLSNYEQMKVERLIEDIILDARVHDHSFTLTTVHLRFNKDPEICALYQKIRAAILLNLGVALPEIPDDIA